MTNSHRARMSAAFAAFALLILGGAAGALDFNLEGVPTRGPADAPVAIVVFYDFQCSHCAKTCPVLLDVVDEYGDLVRVSFVNVPGPGHAYAKQAAEAAMVIGETADFWTVFREMLADQSRFSDDYFLALGERHGVDRETLKARLAEGPYYKLIRRNFLDAIDVGVEATPTAYIGDTQLVGYRDADAFRYYINEALAAKGIESPVGPVEKPKEEPAEAKKAVPTEMVYPVPVLKANDSKLKVKIGDRAPDFTLTTTDVSGRKITLSSFLGEKNVVLSFVPAAWTPVCSAQWPEYNENRKVFDDADAVLIGISADNIPSLFAWTETMGELWFTIASDFYPHGAVAQKLGILRTDGTTERAVIVIDKRGIIRYIDVHDINTQPDFEVLKAELNKLAK